MSAVLRTQLRGVTRRPSRLLLTGLAVLVVSFVVYATVLAQRIAENTLLASLSGTPVAADLVVRDGELTTGQLAAVAKLPGVAEAVGRAGADGRGRLAARGREKTARGPLRQYGHPREQADRCHRAGAPVHHHDRHPEPRGPQDHRPPA